MSNTIYNQGENNKNVTIIIAWDYTNYSQCYGLYVYVSFEIEANYTNHVQGIKEEKISLRKVNPLLLLLSITFKGKKKHYILLITKIQCLCIKKELRLKHKKINNNQEKCGLNMLSSFRKWK